MKNPFKFGSVVEEPYFTNRREEIKKIQSILASENHLIVMSPRRYGKTSLLHKAVKSLARPFISLDLQVVTTVEDFASQLLKRLYRVYPFENIKQHLKTFRILPTITIHPITNETNVSFSPGGPSSVPLEDVLNLIEKVGNENKKPIVVLDEFQEIRRIDKEIDKYLRSVMQYHKNVNYVFLGSQESIIRELFEKKKSPFYHFGMILPLGKIPREEFYEYLCAGLEEVTAESGKFADEILNLTQSHPYYTQQLAFALWEILKDESAAGRPLEKAIAEIVQHHDIDYERFWNTFNRSDMKILIGMAFTSASPLSEVFMREYFSRAGSTVFSAVKRLTQHGLIVKSESGYEIDDPFFKQWIHDRRMK